MIAGLDIEKEDQGAEEDCGDVDKGDSKVDEDDSKVSKHLAVGKPSREDGEGVKFGNREGIDLTTSFI